MRQGPGLYEAACSAHVVIQASEEFTAFGNQKKERKCLLGPFHSGERKLKVFLPPSLDTVEVVCSDDCYWEAQWYPSSGGREHPDPTPVAISVDLKRPASLQEDMRRMIREELSRRAAEAGEESFDEADDFSDPDPDDLYSPHELTGEQLEAELDGAVIGEEDGLIQQGGKAGTATVVEKPGEAVGAEAVVPGEGGSNSPAVSGAGS